MTLLKRLLGFLRDLAAAFIFYTCIPLPPAWIGNFQNVARFAPPVGMLLGSVLGLVDAGLRLLAMPILTRSAIVVSLWVGVTGGLHLDGAMDTADGLAVQDRSRRLQVMADSATGAFGAMVAIVLLLLKIAALSDLETWRGLGLILAAGWGRWGQQMAIVRYPYLKPTGKGAFHKAAIRSGWDVLPGLLLLIGLSAIPVLIEISNWRLSLGAVLGGGTIAVLTGAWFDRQLGGQTGDTYGAIVEWTEALFLVLLTLLNRQS